MIASTLFRDFPQEPTSAFCDTEPSSSEAEQLEDADAQLLLRVGLLALVRRRRKDMEVVTVVQ